MREYRLTRLKGDFCATWTEPDGKRRRVSLRTSDLKEAERRLIIYAREHNPDEALTVDGLWEAYREDRTGRRIAESMAFTGRTIKPAFGHLTSEEVTVATCRAYVAKRRRDRKQDGTIWTELNHLQIVLNWAYKTRRIPHEVYVERPMKPPPLDRRITKEEASRLIAAAKAPHVALAIALLVYTAARSGAIKELTWDRVDMKRGMIHLADPASGKHRKGRATVPIHPELMPYLEDAKPGRISDYVVEWAGKKVASIKRGFARAATDAGLVGVTPHTLRHSSASWLAEDGVPMGEIAAVLGHSDSRTTERIYAKLGPTYLRSAISSLSLENVPTGRAKPETVNGARNKRAVRSEKKLPVVEK